MKQKILNTKLLDEQTAIFFLGGVGFILKHKEKYILIDGYLTDYVDKNCCSELVKWVRNYPAPIKPEELDFIDCVFCTHEHYDHADPETISALAKVNQKAKFYVSAPLAPVIERYGVKKANIVPMKTDTLYNIYDWLSATAIPSAHEEIHRDQNGDCLEVGFLLNIDGKVFYHSGDCCPYDGLEERIKGAAVLMLPVNGRDYYRTVVQDIIGCFNSREAAIIAKNAEAELLIPMHIGLYDVNTASEAYFVECVNEVNPSQTFHIFNPGERYIYQ